MTKAAKLAPFVYRRSGLPPGSFDGRTPKAYKPPVTGKTLRTFPGSLRAHATLLRACRDLLRLRGVPCFRVQQSASQRKDGTYYAGSDKGAPDLFGVLPRGRVLCIEAKSGNARATVDQIAAQSEWIAHGACFLIVRDIAELQRALDTLMASRSVLNHDATQSSEF